MDRTVQRGRGWIGPLAALGVVAAGGALYERRVLNSLAAVPDPDAGRAFAFPGREVHRVTTADGGELHVEECGTGRPLVLLHGHGATMGTFSLLAEHLAEGGRAIAIDLRGFGRSSAIPPGYGWSEMVADVVAVLEQLDLRDAVLVGHSMGGALGLALAIEHPTVARRHLAGLALLNAPARGPADQLRMRVQVAVLDSSRLEHLSRHPRHGVVLSRANFGDQPRLSHVEAARAIGLASPVSRRRGLTRRLLGIDLTPDLERVELPVLLLAGTADRVVPASESVRIAAKVPGARLVLFPGAGHMLPMERSREVAATILRFADGLPGGAVGD